MLNETITEGVKQIVVCSGGVWWVSILAMLGVFYLLNCLFKTGVSLLYVIFYVMGLFKFVIEKLRGKNEV